MRTMAPVGWGLFLVAAIAAVLFWRDLESQRQLLHDTQAQLIEARAALATRATAAPVVAGGTDAPQPAIGTPAESTAPVAAPAKITREEAVAALTEDAVKRQKALLADTEYRKALLARARVNLQQRYAGLAVELGLSDKELNALFDLLTESQEKMMASMVNTADGAQPNAAATAEMQREMETQQKKLKDQLVAMLGPERYAQFEEYDRMQPSRTRVNNLTTLLARSGRPLTNAQTRTLTAVMVTEQKRMEAEAKALRDAGKTETRSQADLQAETNRRILEQAPGFLDSQQVQVVRGRFEQRSTIDRAADRVQQREREVLQESPQ
jgi:hypothetical protein